MPAIDELVALVQLVSKMPDLEQCALTRAFLAVTDAYLAGQRALKAEEENCRPRPEST
jgi:hypothetical protein